MNCDAGSLEDVVPVSNILVMFNNEPFSINDEHLRPITFDYSS